MNFLRVNRVLSKTTTLNYINNKYLFHNLSWLRSYNVTLIWCYLINKYFFCKITEREGERGGGRERGRERGGGRERGREREGEGVRGGGSERGRE